MGNEKNGVGSVNTESQQQIADEVVQAFFGDARKVPRSTLRAIIISAINRAWSDGYVEGSNYQFAIHAQPQRSEQQEWTPRYVAKLFVGNSELRGPLMYLDSYKRIAYAHNAALTAATERLEQELQSVNTLEQQLTAEHQCREQSDRFRERTRGKLNAANNKVQQLTDAALQLKQQLLSALAAIEKALEVLNVIQRYALDKGGDWRVHDTAQSAIKSLQSVDLSLLHEHDAEVRKPLVDALEELLHTSADVRTGVFPTEAHLNARAKAVSLLAKVKP